MMHDASERETVSVIATDSILRSKIALSGTRLHIWCASDHNGYHASVERPSVFESQVPGTQPQAHFVSASKSSQRSDGDLGLFRSLSCVLCCISVTSSCGARAASKKLGQEKLGCQILTFRVLQRSRSTFNILPTDPLCLSVVYQLPTTNVDTKKLERSHRMTAMFETALF